MYDIIDIGIDKSQVYKDLNDISKRLGKFASEVYESTLSVNDKKAKKSLDDIVSSANSIKDVDVDVSVDKSDQKILQRYQKDLKDIDTFKANPEIDVDLDNASKEFDNFADDAEDRVSGLSDYLKGAFTGALGAFAIGGLGDLIGNISETTDSMRTLQAVTGATDTEFESLKNTSKTLYKEGIGESLSDVNRILGVATQQLGNFLEPSQIEDFIAGAGGIAKTFDEDINNVIASARPFIANFGLAGKEATDLISLGMREAGSRSADFLDTINEYSQRVKEAGVNSEQFVGILTRGIQAGTRDTDRLADALAEANTFISEGTALSNVKGIAKGLDGAEKEVADAVAAITEEARKGNITTLEALSLTQEKIGKAIDAGEVSQAFAKSLNIAVAGTPAEEIGVEIFRKTFSAPIDEKQLSERAKEAGEIIGNSIEPIGFEGLRRSIAVIVAEVGERFEPVFTRLGQTFVNLTPIISGIANTLANVFAPVIGFLADNIEVLIPIIGGLGAAIIYMNTSAILPAIASIKAMTAALLANPIGIVIAAVAALAAGIIYLYKNSETFRNIIDSAWASIKQFAQTIYENVRPTLEQLWNIIKIVGEVLWNVLVYVIKNGVVPAIKLWWDIIIAVYTPIWDLAKIIGGFLYDAFVKVWEQIKAFIDSLESIANGVKGFLSSVGLISEETDKNTESLAKNTKAVKDNKQAKDDNIKSNKDTKGSNDDLKDSYDNLGKGIDGIKPPLDNANDGINTYNTNAETAKSKTEQWKNEIERLTKSLADDALKGETQTSAYQNALNEAVKLTKEQNKYNEALKNTKKLIQLLAGFDSDTITTATSVQQPDGNTRQTEGLGSLIDTNQFDAAKEQLDSLKVTYMELLQSNIDLQNVTADTSYAIGQSIAGMVTGSSEGLKSLETIYNSVLDGLVEASLDYLNKQVLIWTADIFGSEVSKLGFAGLATAGILTGIITGFVQAARAAVGAEEGVIGIDSTYNKKPGKTDTIPAMLAPGETVMTAEETKKFRPLFELIRKGGDPYKLLAGNAKGIHAIPIQNDNKEMIRELKGVNNRIARLENATYYAAENSIHRNSIDVKFDNARWKGKDIINGIKKIDKNKIRSM